MIRYAVYAPGHLPNWPQHFKVYMNAAQGDTSTTYSNGDKWYSNVKVAIPFRLFLLVSEDQRPVIWMCVLILAYAFITYKLMGLEYGWLANFALVKPFIWNIQSGNMYPLLVAMGFTPLGALLAGCAKPVFFVVFVVHAYRLYERKRARISNKANGPRAAGGRSTVHS